jgi:cell division protein FtsB
MSKQVDLVVGAIYDLNDDRRAAWSAYIASESEMDKLVDEIVQLKAEIKRLKARRK